jgi:glucosamine-6-phosphate deaminase
MKGNQMKTIIRNEKKETGKAAATDGERLIRAAIKERGKATIIVATGASQFEMLDELVKAKSIDWGKVTAFHLDEYVGLPESHPASFRKYLRERFVAKLPSKIGAFHCVNADSPLGAQAECKRVGQLLRQAEPVDVAFVGIGENGHLAFNDPPADFETEEAYLVVNLDLDCRKQQMGEGWFATIDDVPKQAISMSCPQIMKAKHIICTVPDARKAIAVQRTLEGPITNQVPASILQKHPDTAVYLDQFSASTLSKR